MNPGLKRLGGWLYRRAENVLAAMLAVMFFAFLLQIVFRYVLNWPTGWTNELSVDPLDLDGAVRVRPSC